MSDDLVSRLRDERHCNDWYLRQSAATALTEARAEIERQADLIQRLQAALMFWMPGIDIRLDDATRELAADDASLLAGYSNTTDKPCWGDGMIDRAIAAESELSTLRARASELASENTNLRNDLVQRGMADESLRARVREVVGSLARLTVPEKPRGNAGGYLIFHNDIRAARQLMEEVK